MESLKCTKSVRSRNGNEKCDEKCTIQEREVKKTLDKNLGLWYNMDIKFGRWVGMMKEEIMELIGKKMDLEFMKENLQELMQSGGATSKEGKFVKVPYKLFEMVEMDKSIVLVFLMVMKELTKFDGVRISVNDLLRRNWFEPRRGANGNGEAVKSSLMNLVLLKLFDFSSVVLQFNNPTFDLSGEEKNLKAVTLMEEMKLSWEWNLEFDAEYYNKVTKSGFVMVPYVDVEKICMKANETLGTYGAVVNVVNLYCYLKKEYDYWKYREKMGLIDGGKYVDCPVAMLKKELRIGYESLMDGLEFLVGIGVVDVGGGSLRDVKKIRVVGE